MLLCSVRKRRFLEITCKYFFSSSGITFTLITNDCKKLYFLLLYFFFTAFDTFLFEMTFNVIKQMIELLLSILQLGKFL